MKEMKDVEQMPKILRKYGKLINSVEYVKKSEVEKGKTYGYTINFNKPYKINGKAQSSIKATTAKKARSIIRSNRILSSLATEEQAKTK